MTNQEQKKWQIEDLVKVLKQSRDAVVIVGDKAVKELDLYKIDENSKQHLNRKKMVKEPKNFWSFYKENLFDHEKRKEASPAEKSINSLVGTGVVKTLIDLNYTGNIKVPIMSNTSYTQLKGDVEIARCMSCDKSYKITEDMLNTDTMLKCECKGKIAPTTTLFGEKYLEKHTKAIKDAIFIEKDDEVKLNTHCLIFVGVDFEEDYMHELIESYSAIKSEVSTDENPYFLVMITEKDGVSIEYYQPEFATYEGIADSIDRLIKMF